MATADRLPSRSEVRSTPNGLLRSTRRTHIDLSQLTRLRFLVYCVLGFDLVKSSVLIKRKRERRVLGAALVVSGGVLMWLAPEVLAGAILLAAGIALEIIGITLEHRNGK